ncbi:MAG: hypothetical protein ACTS40_01920 [Candidatus Hodgkinia cicadicola]
MGLNARWLRNVELIEMWSAMVTYYRSLPTSEGRTGESSFTLRFT